MSATNSDSKIWKYFKQGDIVRCEYVWGKALFEVSGFHGNEYCPLLTVYMIGKPRNNAHMCNFDVRKTRLIASARRPFKALTDKQLLKLMSTSNTEAKREMLIRLNQKERVGNV